MNFWVRLDSAFQDPVTVLPEDHALMSQFLSSKDEQYGSSSI